MRRVGGLGLVLALVLSGCSGSDEGEDAPITGILAGRVLDDAGLPIADATVELLLDDVRAQTGVNGSFLMPGIRPGPAVLVARADGFSSQTLRGNLSAGQRLEFEFLLRPAPSLEGRSDSIRFDDSLPCTAPAGLGCGPAGEGEFPRHRFEVEAGLSAIVVELLWTPNVEGTTARLRVDVAASTASACGEVFHSFTGGHPIKTTATSGFPIRGGHLCALVYPSGDDAGLEQTYEMHVSRFYHEQPAPDYSALDE